MIPGHLRRLGARGDHAIEGCDVCRDRGGRFNEDAIVPRLCELLRLPDLDLTVHKVSLDRNVAQKWRYGDICLAGDAAHRQPPTTGLV